MNRYCVSILFIYKCFKRTKNICHRKASYRNFQDFLSTQQHFFSKKVKWLHSNSPLCATYFVQHEKARNGVILHFQFVCPILQSQKIVYLQPLKILKQFAIHLKTFYTFWKSHSLRKLTLKKVAHVWGRSS